MQMQGRFAPYDAGIGIMTDVDVDKCKITYYPATVLRGRAAPVEKIDENIRRLVEKMADILVEKKGIGLAAPQAGVPLRLFIVSLTGKREDVRAYINPTVTPHGDLDEAEEGCLSVPGVWAKIRRYKKATVTATDLDGQPVHRRGGGPLRPLPPARVRPHRGHGHRQSHGRGRPNRPPAATQEAGGRTGREIGELRISIVDCGLSIFDRINNPKSNHEPRLSRQRGVRCSLSRRPEGVRAPSLSHRDPARQSGGSRPQAAADAGGAVGRRAWRGLCRDRERQCAGGGPDGSPPAGRR